MASCERRLLVLAVSATVVLGLAAAQADDGTQDASAGSVSGQMVPGMPDASRSGASGEAPAPGPSTGALPSPPPLPAFCPLTNSPQQQLFGPLPRCKGAGGLSCCSTCQDATTALNVLSLNETSILSFMGISTNPTVSKITESFRSSLGKQQFCSVFAKNSDCLLRIEALYCGITCDPYAAKYLTVNASVGTVTVCPEFASSVYGACASLVIPGFNGPVSQFITSPADMVRMIVGPLAQTATPLSNITTVIQNGTDAGTDSCFNGPPDGEYPKTDLCCDGLSDVPSECLETLPANINADVIINRPLPSTCSQADNTQGNNAFVLVQSSLLLYAFVGLATWWAVLAAISQ